VANRCGVPEGSSGPKNGALRISAGSPFAQGPPELSEGTPLKWRLSGPAALRSAV
jgi:hypothetical protein